MGAVISLRDRWGTRGAIVLLVGLAAGALVFVSPWRALAASHETVVARDGSVLAVTAAAGVDNEVSLAVDGAELLVADATTEISAGSGCVPAGGGEARCSLEGVSAVDVSLGDRTDRGAKRSPVPVPVTWDGGDGDEFFTAAGEPDGPDRYLGGRRVAAQVSYASRTTAVAISNDGIANDGAPAEGDDIGTEFNILFGGAGDDVIAAGAGNELFIGGGAADDVIGSGRGNDLVLESRGADTVRLGPGDDRFSSNVSGTGTDDISGGDGFDTVSYGPRSGPQVVTIDGVADDGEAGEGDNVRADVERVVGGGGADRLTGSPGPDALLGAGGDDIQTAATAATPRTAARATTPSARATTRMGRTH
jgi:Ca2+-binding RTX toxin-like protein